MTELETRTRTTDLVVQNLQARIISGELAPGERLDLDELCTTLGVSRTPVREALLKLETEGLVHRRPFRGVVVSSVDSGSVADVYGVRLHMESLAARVAAGKLTDDDLAAMEEQHQILSSFNRGEISHETFNKHNALFHDVHYRAAGSSELHGYLVNLGKRCERMRLHFDLAGNPNVNVEHQAIIDAGRSGDTDAFVDAVRRHVFNTCVLLLSNVAVGEPVPPLLLAVMSADERSQVEEAIKPTETA